MRFGVFPRLNMAMPRGIGALLSVQFFAIITFSVLFSTLMLYTTNGLHMDDMHATALVASFTAFNYALHIVGGWIGGRYFSYRLLFIIGNALELIACIVLSWTNVTMLYWGLAIFLSGAGINFTCLYCMYTQLFKPEDKRREMAFLWSYSVMNLGFLAGFLISGLLQMHHNYHALFILCAFTNAVTILLMILNWQKLADRSTIFMEHSKKTAKFMMLRGSVIIIALLFILRYLITQTTLSTHLIIALGILMAFIIFLFTFRQPTRQARKKMFAFLILCVAMLCFWSLYLLAPMGLTLFIERNVDRHVMGLLIPPQWYTSINTIVIIISGPILGFVFYKLRHRGVRITIPLQFTIALFLVGIGFIIIPIGIRFAAANGLVSSSTIAISYVLQSLGEMFLQPIGFAMIGQLAPIRLQGIMMGTWLLLSGVAAALAGLFSTWMVHITHGTDPVSTNPAYAHIFNVLGWSALGVGIIMILLIPFLTKLIQYKSLDPTLRYK